MNNPIPAAPNEPCEVSENGEMIRLGRWSLVAIYSAADATQGEYPSKTERLQQLNEIKDSRALLASLRSEVAEQYRVLTARCVRIEAERDRYAALCRSLLDGAIPETNGDYILSHGRHTAARIQMSKMAEARSALKEGEGTR